VMMYLRHESSLQNLTCKNSLFFLNSECQVKIPLCTEWLITIGYFSKITPKLTHLANFCRHLINQLMMIEIDVNTASELAPHLKTAQLEAMSNGDDYVLILLNFKLYKMRLSHGHAPSQIMMEVVRVKGGLKDAKLLGKFFTHLATETSNDHCDGAFLLKGAVHLLGLQTYRQVLKENNFFLNNVATIPVNMEYRAWFVVSDPENQSNDEPNTSFDNCGSCMLNLLLATNVFL